MSEIRVRDWMHYGVVTCQPETPVRDVAMMLDSHDIRLSWSSSQHDAVGVISHRSGERPLYRALYGFGAVKRSTSYEQNCHQCLSGGPHGRSRTDNCGKNSPARCS